MSTQPSSQGPVSGWAVGGLTFAACVLTLVGVFHIIDGLAAILNDDFFVVRANYTFDLDTTAWGWLHLILGILMLAVGFGLFSRRPWAAVTAAALAILSAIANFFFIPFYPFWAILMIALDVWVVWSLTSSRSAIEA